MNRPELGLQLRVQMLLLPGWRQPYGQSPLTPAERFARERASLRDAVRELAYGGTEEQIHLDVIDEWGSCTMTEVLRAIADLAGDRELVRDGAGWVRA